MGARQPAVVGHALQCCQQDVPVVGMLVISPVCSSKVFIAQDLTQ